MKTISRFMVMFLGMAFQAENLIAEGRPVIIEQDRENMTWKVLIQLHPEYVADLGIPISEVFVIMEFDGELVTFLGKEILATNLDQNAKDAIQEILEK